MTLIASIFNEFNLPNSTTWFYFSLLLAIALFFKFTRLLSLRNWDIVTLFLLVPALLLLQEAHTRQAMMAVRFLAGETQQVLGGTLGLGNAEATAAALVPVHLSADRVSSFAFLWLLCGSAYFLVRCLIDLAIVRRPALAPNLNFSGLAWLAVALFVCLSTVAIRKPGAASGTTVGKSTAAVREIQRLPEEVFKQEIANQNLASFDTAFWVERTTAILCHLAVAAGLVCIGLWHFQDAQSGMAAATFYLLLPYTAFHVEQVHHVLPTALLVWAVAAYRRPGLAGILLAAASGTGYFPVLTLPIWISFYWGRGAARFLCCFGSAMVVCLVAIGGILWMDGDLAHSIQAAISLSDWQPWIEPNARTTEGFWTGVKFAWAYRMPVFIAYLAFVVATLFWPSPKNLAAVIALCAALLIGLQFWYADQGGVYVLWYLPFLLLLVFRPNLADRLAVPINSETDWVTRLRRWLVRFASRHFRLPEQAAKV
jgi:hypothetical protein